MIEALTLSPHRRAVTASALLAGLLVLIVGVGLWGWSDLSAESEAIEMRQAEVQAIAERVRARGPGLARAERTLAADPFLPGATPTLAANALQRRIVALAEDAGVVLKTIGAEPAAVETGTLPSVLLQASATARIAALQKLLYRIETETPFVLVDEVALRAPQGRDQTAAPSLDPELDVELRLIGYPKRTGSER